MKFVEIYTDGACSGNPGPGGWAAVLRYGEHEREISGAEKETTNNRMELTAVIEAISALKEPCMVDVYTDSAYVEHAFNRGWLTNWQAHEWKTSSKSPVENQDLWKRLLPLTNEHQVAFHKVKGHSDNALNNRCDELARSAIQTLTGIPQKKTSKKSKKPDKDSSML